MAFYNQKMAGNKALSKAWRAAYGKRLNQDKEISLPEICEEITRRMRRSRRPRKRLSLRSFSTLLSGAVRIYRDEVDSLLKDTLNCSLFKKSVTLEPADARTKQSHAGDQSESIEKDSDDRRSSPVDTLEDMSDDDDESTVFSVTTDTNQKSEDSNGIEVTVEKRDQIVQTSPNMQLRGFDPNLPFGYFIVHDKYDSRIPSKIIFCSLTENI